MIDGFDAGFGCEMSAGFAGGVDGDALAGASCFFNGGSELVFGILKGRDEVAIDKRIATCFINLDEVGTFFNLFANGGDKLAGVVRVIGVGENVLRGIEMVGVFVTAENVDGIAADAQARAGNFATIDGVANSGVGRTGAFGTHVALSGKAGHQVGAGG